RIWEYIYTHNYSHGHLVRFRFEGTEVISGKEYHLLKPVLQIDYTDDGNYSNPHEVEPTDWPVAYLREEDGKVYRIFPEGMNIESTEEERTEYGEMLIMDFTLQEGDSIRILDRWYPGEEYRNSVFVAGETGLQTVGGELCRSVKCAALGEWINGEFISLEQDGSIVEGIGPTAACAGTLAALTGNYAMNTPPPHLNNVYDLEGNVIFAGLNQTGMLSGLSVVYASDNTSVVYDLTGREVARGENATDGLIPGIYIVRKGNTISKTMIK
ncbi:MAG: T9SS type A sorting domain-containing protein, partial [Muribaculaceae bacterium]|nr:T9SS type A sorting domain-containing protein [Muribaculaceae bacterium]